MNIINYKEFEQLRISEFGSNKNEINNLTDWEFMEDLWIGESIFFSEWLRLESKPELTKSISVNFSDFSEQQISKILEKLKLPLKKGMKIKETEKIFGNPLKTYSFIENNISYEYLIGIENLNEYYLSLTIEMDNGLSYFVMMNHDKTINELKSK